MNTQDRQHAAVAATLRQDGTHGQAHVKPPEAKPAKPRFMRVELLRKYCPAALVDDDENVTPQAEYPLEMFPAGTVMKLLREEAMTLLRSENHAARPARDEDGDE